MKWLKKMGFSFRSQMMYEYEVREGDNGIWASRNGFFECGVSAGDDWFNLKHAQIPEIQSIKPGEIKKIKIVIES